MKKNIILIFILAPVLTYTQANRLIRQAQNTTHLEDKIKLLNEAITLDPTKLDAYFYRGLTKNDMGDYYGAIVDYSKVIVEEPDADTYFNRGNSKYSLEDFEAAKADYAKAIALDPYFVDALFSLGCAHYDLGEYDDALASFNTVLKIQPYYMKAYLLRADIYAQKKQYKNALKDYSLSIYIDPNANTYYKRGVFYLTINYYKKAKSDLTQALRLNDNNGFAYFYRGTTELLLGKYKSALTDFETALQFDTLDFDAMLGLAMAYQKMNNLNKAGEYFNKAKEILKTNTESTSGIDVFKNTYWHQNQYYFFSDAFKGLEGL